jgi:hypothetical protein
MPRHRADIDADGKDREAARAARVVVFGIKLAHLRGDVALEEPATHDQQHQREQERGVESHGDMACAHQKRARHHRVAPSDETIGEPAAEHRREIDEARVKTVDLRRERDGAHPPEDRFKDRAERGEARDVADMPGHEQRLRHVQHQERRHAVIGKTLPGFGESEKTQRRRLAEERSATRLQARCVLNTRHLRDRPRIIGAVSLNSPIETIPAIFPSVK